MWRRMDPRTHWEDILMRIEISNRDEAMERRVQNSSNNLINRSENRLFFMLAWHTTGAGGMRNNTVRTMVLQQVAATRPPLPPNSTRGLTPGLINPRLGNVVGNRIPFPARRPDQGRLRLGTGRHPRAQAVVTANPAAANVAQVNPPQSNHDGRGNTKRRRASREHKGRPSKRRRYAYEDSDEEDEGTESDDTKSSAVRIEPLSSCGSR